MSPSMLNIDKLNETNYDTWNIQMMSVLIYQDLWTVTSGEFLEPLEDPEKTQWRTKDQKAKAIIILSLSPMQIVHVKHSLSSKSAWDSLCDIHKPKGPARKISMFKILLGMRMNDDDCIQKYICQFTETVEKLSEIGVSLQDELFVIMLLASLPKSYENLVVALESRDELPSLNVIKIKLIEEGERRKVNSVSTSNNDVQAFMVKNNSNLKKNTSYVTEPGRTDNTKKRNLKCYNCGMKGHFATQCNMKKREFKDRQNFHNALFSTVNDKLIDANEWSIDSGASSHLCCNKNLFEQFENFEDTVILPDNSKLLVRGKGKVHLKTNRYNVTLKDVLYIPEIQCNFISIAKAVSSGYTV